MARCPGGGPRIIVTDRAVLRFDEETGEVVLTSVHPGTTVDDVRAEVGWELKVADDVETTPEPTDEELRIIREELDPRGLHVAGR